MVDQEKTRRMLIELLELEDGLSKWELAFVEDQGNRRGDLSEKQATKIEQIWNDRIGNR